MNNWHRLVWTLNKTKSGSNLAALYKKGATNQFWFEPYIGPPLSNQLTFHVQCNPGDMVGDWSTCLLLPMGSTPFAPPARPTALTERLEGSITIGGQLETLRIYMAVKKNGKKTLDLRRGPLFVGRSGKGGSGDTGGATAHN